MKKFLKIILIGLVTTMFRIIFQLLIPDTGQSVLPQSKFVITGTLPIVFMMYGVLVYSLLAALFLLIRKKIRGNRIACGLQFGTALSLLWSVYLLEPLPHAKSFMIDNFAYIAADSIALMIMGVLTGFLLSVPNRNVLEKVKWNVRDYVSAALTSIIFVMGRLVQYKVFHIYSLFDSRKMNTILWCILAGVVSCVVVVWIAKRSKMYLALFVFAVNLILFNGFMVLVFDMSKLTLGWWDLVLRTVMDVLTVVIGFLVSLTQCVTIQE